MSSSIPTFENPDRFRVYTKKEYLSLDGTTAHSQTFIHLSSKGGSGNIVSLLVYDPAAMNGKVLPTRAYACSFSKRQARGIDMGRAIRQASSQGILSPEAQSEFEHAIAEGEGRFQSTRDFSSFLLQKVAEGYPVISHESCSSPDILAQVLRGVPRKFTEFRYSTSRALGNYLNKAKSDVLAEEEEEEISDAKVMTREQEREIFTIYNGAKFHIRDGIYCMAQNSSYNIKRMRRLESIAASAEDTIANANLPLVLAMAKRTRWAYVDFSDLITEGNMSILRAIKGFDVSRGFKFSTYACRAILKAFSRLSIKETHHQRFFIPYDPEMERSNQRELVNLEQENFYLGDLKEALQKNLAHLNKDEDFVIRHRHAIPKNGETLVPETLKKVGEQMGLTKERIRQIQKVAQRKIKRALERMLEPV